MKRYFKMMLNMICVFLIAYMTCNPVLANDTDPTQVPLKIEQTGEAGHYVFESMKSGNPMPEGANNTYSFEISKKYKTLLLTFVKPGIYEYKIRQKETPKKEYSISITVKNGVNNTLTPEVIVSNDQNQKVSSIRCTNDEKTQTTNKSTASTNTGVQINTSTYAILTIVCIIYLIFIWIKQRA